MLKSSHYSLATNMLILGFFKYYDFGLENLNALSGWLGTGPHSSRCR